MIKTETKKQSRDVFALSKTIKAVTKAVATSYVFLVLAFVILALVYTYTPMPDKLLTPSVSIISIVSMFIAGFISSAKAKTQGLIHGALAGVLYALIRLGLGIAIFKTYVPSKSIPEAMALSVIVSAIGGVFGVNFQRKTPKKRKRK